ncbi:MAG TPA: hypothetical protein VJ770_21720 [Stellaceae bacterium]|nr:hypothetical protein [Stellaceae bacterium]
MEGVTTKPFPAPERPADGRRLCRFGESASAPDIRPAAAHQPSARAGRWDAALAAAIGTPKTLLLRDGRRMHRFPAAVIPPAPTALAAALVSAARQHNAVLVADGPELVVVEPKGSTLPREMLARIRANAGEIIAALRGEPFPRGRIITLYDGGAP